MIDVMKNYPLVDQKIKYRTHYSRGFIVDRTMNAEVFQLIGIITMV